MKLNVILWAVLSIVFAGELHAGENLRTGRGTLVYAGSITYVDVTNRVLSVAGSDRFRNRTGILMGENPGGAKQSTKKYEGSQSVSSYALESGPRDFSIPMLCHIISLLEKEAKKLRLDELTVGLPVEIEYIKSAGDGWRATAIVLRQPIPDPRLIKK